jgi:hypothetical protein
MVMDEDLEKKDYVAMTSHRIDPHSVPPTHRRSRAASYTPGKGTFNNDVTLSEEFRKGDLFKDHFDDLEVYEDHL